MSTSAPLVTAVDFDPAIGDLQEHMPDWYAIQNPASEMFKVASALCSQIDLISALWEQPYLNQVITTANADGIFHNFAFAWGLQGEQLPTVLPTIVPYIQALAADDGSLNSAYAILGALINLGNDSGGPLLTFAADGSGLTFPADGDGLIMYQYTPENAPSLLGSPLFAADGLGETFAADGSGLKFTTNAALDIVPDFSTQVVTVRVLAGLTYDRPAFARAVARLQSADWYPSVIEEVSSI